MESSDLHERARKIINRRGLGALANNTKWGEFFSLIEKLGVPLAFKLIDDEAEVLCKRIWCPVATYVEGSLMGPYPFYWVEWVRSSQFDTVAAIAETVGLECSVEAGVATVYGYR